VWVLLLWLPEGVLLLALQKHKQQHEQQFPPFGISFAQRAALAVVYLLLQRR
jgi:hypothetical protein